MRRSKLICSAVLASVLLLTADGRRPISRAEPRLIAQGTYPRVTIRAQSGATIEFRTRNGQTVRGVPPAIRAIPRLVLYRNGVLTDASERTLVVTLNGIAASKTMAIALEISTLHPDPDPMEDAESIVAWRESLAPPAHGDALTHTITFGAEVHEPGGSVPMPTDYFRLRLRIHSAGNDADTRPWALEQDHAFLMESQWIAQLPDVREESSGAAPDELLVYYCDMFPFQRDRSDVSTRLARERVPAFVEAELVPAMVRAFRTQSDDWGFGWHGEWTSYRKGESLGRLGVALTDGRTWYHGSAPVTGHSAISLNANAPPDFASFETLADALISTFHHELFHNVQRSIHQHLGGDGDVDADREAWHFFSEGTAFLASSVGLPTAHFGSQATSRRHVSRSNLQMDQFTWGSGSAVDRHGALYWRFLYEKCGGMVDGQEEPGRGMTVVRNALTTLYSGEVVSISSSGSLLASLGPVMDRAIAAAPTCPFDTFEESLAQFARAVYALRMEGGRCVAPGLPVGCGFFDPHDQYSEPPAAELSYGGEQNLRYWSAIRRSFGMAFVDIALDDAGDGRSLVLEFRADRRLGETFAVQALRLLDRMPVADAEVLTQTCPDGRLVYRLPTIDPGEWNRLGLIVVRTDHNERPGTVAGYAVRLRAMDAGSPLCKNPNAVNSGSAGYVGAEVLLP